VLLVSLATWQNAIFPHQKAVQLALGVLLTLLIIRAVINGYRQKLPTVAFSLKGEWLEISPEQQTSWMVTKQSRVTSVVLFIHLVSAVNVKNSKFVLVFNDQLSQRNFRRLCRVVFFQQQTVGETQ
jgi:hypothetical protein